MDNYRDSPRSILTIHSILKKISPDTTFTEECPSQKKRVSFNKRSLKEARKIMKLRNRARKAQDVCCILF